MLDTSVKAEVVKTKTLRKGSQKTAAFRALAQKDTFFIVRKKLVKDCPPVETAGFLHLGDFDINCYVLADGTRALSGREMQRALNMVDEVAEGKQNPGTRLTRYLNQKSLIPFIFKDKEPDHFEPNLNFEGLPDEIHYCTAHRDGDWVTWRCPLCEGYERRYNWRTGKMLINRAGSTAQHTAASTKPENMEALTDIKNEN